MSGAEALAVVGIISNILQLADFCSRVTDRAVEIAGRTSELPGSFSDLRIVLAVVRLNLRKLNKRLDSTDTDDETASVLRDLVTLIERDVRNIQKHLQKLPEPGASWAKITVKAVISVFNEGKVKTLAANIMQNVELLSQTVTASLPTAEEIAKAVNDRVTANGIDRKLSLILNRMKSTATTRAETNRQVFESQSQAHRASNSMNIPGTTHVNNTYITLKVPYDQYGAQLDQNGGNLTVPGKGIPFMPLKHAISNPNLQNGAGDRRSTAGASVIAAPVLDIIPNHHPMDYSLPKTSRSNTTKTFRHASSKSAIVTAHELDGLSNMDGDTVVGSVVPSYIGEHPKARSYPSPPKHLYQQHQQQQKQSLRIAPTVPQEQLHTTVFELDDGSLPLLTRTLSPSTIETASSVGTASDIWSETMTEPHIPDAQTIISTSSVASEDTDGINAANAFIRRGAAAVTTNPSEAKRAYLSALNACKRIVTYSPAFAVRKYRALTIASIGLSLCTVERDRYLAKARAYNEQALSAACATKDDSLELRVLLDEADLQMKEARTAEKAGRDATMKHFTAFGAYQTVASRMSEAATSRARRASAAARPHHLSSPSSASFFSSATASSSHSPLLHLLSSLPSIADCNTHAQALIGSGKAAQLLSRNAGTFQSTHGRILTPRAYYEQALAACKTGVEVAAKQAAAAQARGDPDWARQPVEELALLRETEDLVMRLLVTPAGSR